MNEIHSQLPQEAGGQTPTVADMKPGSVARLVHVGGDRNFRRRLLELGLLPGGVVRLIRRADVGGVLELEVRRSRVSVRLSEARELQVAAPDDAFPGDPRP